MRRARYFALGLLLALAGGAVAVTQGGFPSRPIFQAITLNGSLTANAGATAATSLILPKTDATLYSLLGRGQAGPGMQGRWDSGTSNRFLSFGTYDNAGTYTEGLRLQGNEGIFNAAGDTGDVLQTTGKSGAYGLRVSSSNGGSGTQFGLRLTAGATSSDVAFTVQNQAATLNFFAIDGAGNISAPSAASVPWTPSQTTTSTSGTVTGCTTSPTITINWVKVGSIVSASIQGAGSCTSNATTFTLTGAIPASMVTTNAHNILVSGMQDNGVVLSSAIVSIPAASGTTITFQKADGTAWTGSGSKAWNLGTFTYPIN